MKALIFFFYIGLCASTWGAQPVSELFLEHAWTGCIPCLEKDIAAGVDVNVRDPSGSTALIAALSGQQPTIAKWLIESGADPRIGRFDGFMPSHYATRYLDLLKSVHAHGGDIFARTQNGVTPLYTAVTYGNLRSISWLMDMGASPAEKDINGRNALHVAVEYANSPRIVNQLAGIKDTSTDWINDSDNDGETALMKAIKLGRPLLADALLTLGARVDVVNKTGHNLAHLAVQSGNVNVWKWVRQHGVDLNARDKENLSPRELAAQSAAADMLSRLLGESGLDLRAPDGKSLLHRAVQGGRLENARLLLDRQPTLIDAADDEGETAAMLAAKGGRLEMLQLLSARGADFRRTNGRGATALSLAADTRQSQIVEWLSQQP